MTNRPDISLLFDLFVTAQRMRRVLSEGLLASGMRPDEYAVYSLLLEGGPMTASDMSKHLGLPLSTVLDYLRTMTAAGHITKAAHPSDGRALVVSLSRSGVAMHRRAHAHWEVVRKRVEGNLEMPIAQARLALRAIDDAASRALG